VSVTGTINDIVYPFVPAVGLPGDYNDDGKVDAADYVVWRKNEGTNIVLPNNPIGGTIDQAQYDQWRSRFGQTAASGSANSIVPEPSTLLLFLAFVAYLTNYDANFLRLRSRFR
jgi:hypothetical protein